MKSDLFTSIAVFVVGTVVAFITCNMILPGIEDFEIKTIDIDSSTSLSDPNAEVFNYRAINPTVEVYVGEGCESYDENGNCIDNGILNTEENNSNQNNPNENTNTEEENSNSEEDTEDDTGENENGTTD